MQVSLVALPGESGKVRRQSERDKRTMAVTILAHIVVLPAGRLKSALLLGKR